MFEFHAIFGKPIQAWRFVVLGSVATKTLPADIIGHDQHDVGFVESVGLARQEGQQK